MVEHDNRGEDLNRYLDPKLRPLDLADDEIAALVAFMQAFGGEGYADGPPARCPE